MRFFNPPKLLTWLCLIALTWPCVAEDAKIEYVEKDGKISITIDGERFTEFVTKDTPRPYLYPIIGPTGAEMTRSYPMIKGVAGESSDHPHHRSLWFAHGGIGGHDFWHEKGGKTTQIKSTAEVVNFELFTSSNRFVTGISSTDRWEANEGSLILAGGTEIHASVESDSTRLIDYQTSIAAPPGTKEVVFADTKEGTMAIRLAPQLRLKGEVATGKAINSEGDKDAKVWGKRAKWVAYWGVIDGKTCGVAIFDHPTNLRHPTWWHARDYGLVAANPFGISDFEKGKHKRGAGNYTIKQGETLQLQYRFVFFAGTAEEADIAGKYDQWVNETTPAKDEKK